MSDWNDLFNRPPDITITVDDAIAEGILAPTDIAPTSPRFVIGGVVVSDGVLARIGHDLSRIRPLVQRHSQGDWGELEAEDAAAQTGQMHTSSVVRGQWMSVYHIDDATVWVLTNSNGHAPDTVTTVLLPSEY